MHIVMMADDDVTSFIWDFQFIYKKSYFVVAYEFHEFLHSIFDA